MTLSVRPLKELCKPTMGRTPPRGNSRYWDRLRTTKNIWISIADITKSEDGILLDSKEYLSDEGAKMFPKVKEGTLLLSFKLSIGKLAVAGTELQTNEAILALNDLNEELILRDYLYFYLLGFDWSDSLQGRSKVKGNTLNKSILELLPIQFPSSKRRQQEIVERLKSAFAEIDSLERNLELGHQIANQLFMSLLSKELTPRDNESDSYNRSLSEEIAIGWHKVVLKQICDVDWGNTKLTKSSYVPDGKFLAVSAAGADGQIDHYEHEANVPVLSAIGAQCGRMFYPGERFTAIKNTITLTPKVNMADGKFLYYLLTYVDLPQRGAGQPFISKGDIEMFTVVVPQSEETQREIVKKLDTAFVEIELIKSRIKAKIEYAIALRRSLLSNAFTQEETVA